LLRTRRGGSRESPEALQVQFLGVVAAISAEGDAEGRSPEATVREKQK